MAAGNYKTWNAAILFSGQMDPSMNRSVRQVNNSLNSISRHAERTSHLLRGITYAAVGWSAVGLLIRGAVMGVKGMVDATGQEETRLAVLQQLLKDNSLVAKQGATAYLEQANALSEVAQKLEDGGVFSHDIYMQAAFTLARFKLTGGYINAMLPGLADVLATTKGIHATTEDAAAASLAFGKAIEGGNLLLLKRQGIVFKGDQKLLETQFKAMDTYHQIQFLTAKMRTDFGGVEQAIAKLPEGKFAFFFNEWKSFLDTAGAPIYEGMSNVAMGIGKLLQTLRPTFTEMSKLLGAGFTGFGDWLQYTLVPLLKLEIPDATKAFGGQLQWLFANLGDMGKEVYGIFSHGLGFEDMFTQKGRDSFNKGIHDRLQGVNIGLQKFVDGMRTWGPLISEWMNKLGDLFAGFDQNLFGSWITNTANQAATASDNVLKHIKSGWGTLPSWFESDIIGPMKKSLFEPIGGEGNFKSALALTHGDIKGAISAQDPQTPMGKLVKNVAGGVANFPQGAPQSVLEMLKALSFKFDTPEAQEFRKYIDKQIEDSKKLDEANIKSTFKVEQFNQAIQGAMDRLNQAFMFGDWGNGGPSSAGPMGGRNPWIPKSLGGSGGAAFTPNAAGYRVLEEYDSEGRSSRIGPLGNRIQTGEIGLGPDLASKYGAQQGDMILTSQHGWRKMTESSAKAWAIEYHADTPGQFATGREREKILAVKHKGETKNFDANRDTSKDGASFTYAPVIHIASNGETSEAALQRILKTHSKDFEQMHRNAQHEKERRSLFTEVA